MYSPGTMSTRIPMPSTDAAVAGPMVQIRIPLRSRMSFPVSRSLRKKYFTPFALVKMIQ